MISVFGNLSAARVALYVGVGVGCMVGTDETGALDGKADGMDDGMDDGTEEGLLDGKADGMDDGIEEGADDGAAVMSRYTSSPPNEYRSNSFCCTVSSSTYIDSAWYIRV